MSASFSCYVLSTSNERSEWIDGGADRATEVAASLIGGVLRWRPRRRRTSSMGGFDCLRGMCFDVFYALGLRR